MQKPKEYQSYILYQEEAAYLKKQQVVQRCFSELQTGIAINIPKSSKTEQKGVFL